MAYSKIPPSQKSNMTYINDTKNMHLSIPRTTLEAHFKFAVEMYIVIKAKGKSS